MSSVTSSVRTPLVTGGKKAKDVTNDILEYQRLKSEVEEVETRARDLDLQLVSKREELKEAQASGANFQGETNDAKDFYDATKRWVDTSLRIAM